MHWLCWLIYSTVKALFPSCASGWDAMCFWCWTVSFQYCPFHGLCNSVLSQFGLGRGTHQVSEVQSIFRASSKRLFCCLIQPGNDSVEAEGRERARSCLLASCSLAVLVGGMWKQALRSSQLFPAHSREKCLCSLVFFLPVFCRLLQLRGTRGVKAVCLYACQKSHPYFLSVVQAIPSSFKAHVLH